MDLEQTAIGRIQLASQMSLTYYKEPLTVCISGGKDSDVLLELTRRSGVPFVIQHSHTTVDAPPTVRHVRSIFKRYEERGIKCVLSKPAMTMWELIVHKKMPPTRLVRYCCEYLKEQFGANKHIMTGVRWSESQKRKKRGIYEGAHRSVEKRIILMNDNEDKRRLTERCQMLASTVTNPIIDWTDKDVYSYIDSEHIEINPLYGCGFKRVGCVGCPMAGKLLRRMEFEMFPTYKRAYIRSFDKMLEARSASGLKITIPHWNNGKNVFRWWMEERFHPDQLMLEGFEEN